MSREFTYCPKCGKIYDGYRSSVNGKLLPCIICGYDTEFVVNPKWGINEEARKKIFDKYRYGEITMEEFDREWLEYCRPFVEEVVSKRPEFCREEYEKIPAKEKEIDEHFEKIRKEVHSSSGTKSTNSYTPTIKCPYCKSSNTKKISTMSRMISGGLFGFGSKKVGKQWHCNNCGSDF